MKRIMFSTDNQLKDLSELVREYLCAASQPFAAAIDSAKAQLCSANFKLNQASQACDAAQRQLEQVKKTQSNVTVDMSEIVTKAEAAVNQASEELDHATEAQLQAGDAYDVACAPVQNWMVVQTYVENVRQTFSEEEDIAAARLDEYEKAEKRRLEAIEEERYVCQTCKGRGGYCRDCDMTR